MKNDHSSVTSIFCSLPRCMVLLAALLAAGCVVKKQQPAPAEPSRYSEGQFFSRDGIPLADGDIPALYPHADFFLVGETHTAELPKTVAARLLAALSKQRKRPVLGLEMLPAKSQPVLDAFNRKLLSLDVFSKAVQWQKIWGYDYGLYRPLLTEAAARDIRVYGLNIPHIVLRKAVEDKAPTPMRIPVSQKKWLPSQVIPPPQEQLPMLEKVFLGHQDMRRKNPATEPLPQDAAFARFIQVQSIWDSTMAENAAKIRKKTGSPMVILAGSSHVESGYGIASRLKIFAPASQAVLAMPVENPEILATRPTGMTEDEHKVLRGTADIFFYSPPAPKAVIGLRLDVENEKIRIVQVMENSPASRAGLREGDIITFVNEEPVTRLADLHRVAVEGQRTNGPFIFTVVRGQQTIHCNVIF